MKLKVQKGFSLVELLIAMFIFSISTMALMPLLVTTLHLNKSTTYETLAKNLATKKVEDLLSMSKSEVDNLLAGANSYASPTEYLTEDGQISVSTNSKAIFRRTWGINVVPGVTTEPKPVVLTSIVDFTYKGKTYSKSFTTMWSF